ARALPAPIALPATRPVPAPIAAPAPMRPEAEPMAAPAKAPIAVPATALPTAALFAASPGVCPTAFCAVIWQATSSRLNASGDFPRPGMASTIGPVGAVDAQAASRLADANIARTIDAVRTAVIGRPPMING